MCTTPVDDFETILNERCANDDVKRAGPLVESKTDWLNRFAPLFFLLGVSLAIGVLYAPVLTSGFAFGLDAYGHLSKISYIQAFGLTRWDASWYAGSRFLGSYSPLFYFLFLPFNSIGVSIAQFSLIFIVTSCFFVSLLVWQHARKFWPSMAAGLFAAFSMNWAYYTLSVGNYPFVASVWTLPAALYCYARFRGSVASRSDGRFAFLALSGVLVSGFLLHYVTGFLVVACVGFLAFQDASGPILRRVRSVFALLAPVVLLAGFWLVNLVNTKTIWAREGGGSFLDLFGILNAAPDSWGYGAFAVGPFMALFLLLLAWIWYKKSLDRPLADMALFFGAVLLLATAVPDLFSDIGVGLPFGFSAVRLSLYLAIFASAFIGLALARLPWNSRSAAVMAFFLSLSFLMVFPLVHYKVGGQSTRLELFPQIDSKLPASGLYEYRTWDDAFVVGEYLNCFRPAQAQTLGYFDLGSLDHAELAQLDSVVKAGGPNATSFLDAFGIKYLVGRASDMGPLPDARILAVVPLEGEPFEVLERPIAPRILDAEDQAGHVLAYSVNVSSPESVRIDFSQPADASVIVHFRQFHDSRWSATEWPSGRTLGIQHNSYGLMQVQPSAGTRAVTFEYGFDAIDAVGLLLSLVGVVALVWSTRHLNAFEDR